ncbi:rod shape-determining protein MreD [Microaerobacter geothermalis]|uniref:rod shape-determining protein MreD n=1 Tax=Microaerobacter geothermalis TaxID=674972 RepID=UPI001F1F2709|nr:rod shape-determining protein MreD [Microaerobacter geothermalis]MCF6092708.1 rod shape-determining protein MreD [Microaerobacter geothermalis]
MNQIIFSLILLVLFIVEGTTFQVFYADLTDLTYVMIPRYALTFILYASFYIGRIRGMWYGIAIGFLQDIIYGDIVGIYTFTMGVVAYFSGLTFKIFHPNVLLIILSLGASLFFHEGIAYGLFYLFSLTDVGWRWQLSNVWIPTVLLNMGFGILVHYVTQRWMVTLDGLEEEEKSS